MAKRTLEPRIGFADMRTRLQFTEIALELAGEDGDAEVAALGPPLRALLLRWADLDRERHEALKHRLWVTARCKAASQRLGAALTALHHGTLSAVGLDRRAPLYTSLFPRPLSALLKPAVEGRLAVAQALLDRLGPSAAHADLARAHAANLAAAVAYATSALRERVRTQAQAVDLRARIDELWEDENRGLQVTEGTLRALAAGRRLGMPWVDSFFPESPWRKPKPPRAPAPSPGA